MFVFDVICSMCLRNDYVRVLKSVSDKCFNALKLFKCDTDQRFSMTYHQNLNPQQVFGKCIIQRMAKSCPALKIVGKTILCTYTLLIMRDK